VTPSQNVMANTWSTTKLQATILDPLLFPSPKQVSYHSALHYRNIL
jgi:hypothetical protein